MQSKLYAKNTLRMIQSALIVQEQFLLSCLPKNVVKQ